MYKPPQQTGGDYITYVNPVQPGNNTAYGSSISLYDIAISTTISTSYLDFIRGQISTEKSLVQQYSSFIISSGVHSTLINSFLPQANTDYTQAKITYYAALGAYSTYVSSLSTYTNISSQVSNTIGPLAASSAGLYSQLSSLQSTIAFLENYSTIYYNTYLTALTNVTIAQNISTTILANQMQQYSSILGVQSTIFPAFQTETANNSTITGLTAEMNAKLVNLANLKLSYRPQLTTLQQNQLQSQTIYTNSLAQDKYLSSLNNEVTSTATYNSTIAALKQMELTFQYGNQFGGAYTPGWPPPSTPLGVNPQMDALIVNYNGLLKTIDALEQNKIAATNQRIIDSQFATKIIETTYNDILSGYDSTIYSFVQQRDICAKNISTSETTLGNYSMSTIAVQKLLSTTYSMQSINSRYASSLSTYSSFVNSTLGNLYNYQLALTSAEFKYKTDVDLSGTYTGEIDALNAKIADLSDLYSTSIAQGGGGYIEGFLDSVLGGAPDATNSVLGGAPDSDLYSDLPEDIQIGGAGMVITSGVSAALVALQADLQSYETDTLTINSQLSTTMWNELDTYIGTAALVSSYVMLQIGATLTTGYNPVSITSTSIANATNKITQLNSISNQITSFINTCQAEQLYKQMYVAVKNVYELQSKYNLTTGDINKLMSGADFTNTMATYDIYVQQVNRYMDTRSTIFSNLSSNLQSQLNMFDLNYRTALTATYAVNVQYQWTDATGAHVLTSNVTINPPLPLLMNPPARLPARNTPFSQSGFIPTLPVCVVGTLNQLQTTYAIQPRNTTTIGFATTTIPYDNVGPVGRYVQLKISTTPIVVSQIVVIDKSGRNVALGAPAPGAPGIVDGSIVSFMPDGTRAYTPQIYAGTSVTLPAGATITIDLGKPYQLMAIQLFQLANPVVSTGGITYTILDASNNGIVSYSLPGGSASAQTNLDLRNTNLLTQANIGNYPSYIIVNQPGACGIMARYVRIMAPASGAPAGFYFHISQVAVIGNNGQNLALNASVTLMSGDTTSWNSSSSYIAGNLVASSGRYIALQNMPAGAPAPSTTPISGARLWATYTGPTPPATMPAGAPISVITDGTYYARPEQYCYVGCPSYIEIDLGSVVDVAAVHIYNKSNNPDLYQSSLSVALLTQERLYGKIVTLNTNLSKEVVDLGSVGSDARCPVQLAWPSTYGNAGLLCRYVAITGCNGITRIEIVDKLGISVGLYKSVTGDNASAAAMLSSDQSTTPYVGTWCMLDIGQVKEVCAVRTYGTLPSGAMIYFSADAMTGLPTPPSWLLKSSFYGMIDTRVDPEDSSFPTTILKSITQYGVLGVYGQKINVTATGVTPTYWVVDATGKGFGPFTTAINMGRFFEITAIITSVAGCTITMYDCNNIVVSQGFSATTATSFTFGGTTQNGYVGQFTAPGLDAPLVALIPRTPYPIRYGYTPVAGSVAPAAVPPATTPALPFTTTAFTPNYWQGAGVYARYIRITPAVGKFLAVSQIIAVDASGINVAFQKPVYSIPGGGTGGVASAAAATIVDGDYQDILGRASQMSYNNYIPRVSAAAFVSPTQTATTSYATNSTYIIIDMLREYAINSIIYLSTSDTDRKTNIGAIVQLYDAQELLVGIHPVSTLIYNWGLDMLDFRMDITAPTNDAPCRTRVEVRERQLVLGPAGCGIMGQYVRITPIAAGNVELSQVILRDPTGANVAKFKPTYSPNTAAYPNNMTNSNSVVDGNYYMKTAAVGFMGNTYVEINLQQEYELVTIIVASLTTTTTATQNNMSISFYNKYRDLIALQSNVYTYTQNSVSRSINMTNFSYVTTQIGVQNRGVVVPDKVNSGLQPAADPNISAGVTLPTQNLNGAGTSCVAIVDAPPPRDSSGNIMNVRYVRIFNQLQYVQISQLMVYDGGGNNIGYHAPTNATEILSGRYAAFATDGTGGFFHTPRAESSCYISEINQYNLLDITLATTSSVSAVRYIPPPTNQMRAVGMRVQLLDVGKNILTQYVFTASDIGELLIDFRSVAAKATIPILQTIMPKIGSLY